MAYITLSNANKIIYNSDIKSLDLTGEVYKIPIRFFSKYEENSLLAIKELLEDPDKYFTEIYVPYHPVDTYTYIYEGRSPSYHEFADCPRLNSDYENFEVPKEIRSQGHEVVEEFREWFETVKHLLEKPDIFVERLRIKWGIVTNPRVIKKDNSGNTIVDNYTIEELEEIIDSKIKEAGKYFYKSHKNLVILKKFSKNTFLAFKPDPIENNNTGYPDWRIRSN
jgi:hypothetical protein